LKSWLTRIKQATYNTTFMYNLRMVIAFAGTAFVPYFMGYQIATIPLTLGVVAAGLSDIDDRFSVRIMNLIYTYIGFFITAASVYFLFPYPIIFALGLIVSCIGWILLGSTWLAGSSLRHHFLWLFSHFRVFDVRCWTI